MVYLKHVLIGLAVACLLRVFWWIYVHIHLGKDSIIVPSPRLLLDPVFLVLAVICVGLVVFLGKA